ncbi:hypothetical protein CVT23_19880 [Minwuia thermotolerans]|uniref:Uncharacterized protein n=1 Tax=Minwuia thermotolerans TaxID=2056226 RepID=A0A2M9FW98_9PROT|nr:hypothetical protein CVT23_19880 [Minwuia thermotolerans]
MGICAAQVIDTKQWCHSFICVGFLSVFCQQCLEQLERSLIRLAFFKSADEAFFVDPFNRSLHYVLRERS